MIEFFEFLNTCSPYRVVTYLIFIIVITFVIFAGISDIIRRIKGDGKVETEAKKEEENIDGKNG